MSFVGILALAVVCLVSYAIGSGSNDAAHIAAFVFIAAALLLYASPSLVAAGRKHRNQTAIIVLNVLGGWTLLGWVIALVWAYSAQDGRGSGASPDPDDALMRCPACAEDIKAAAKVCRYCGRDVAPA